MSPCLPFLAPALATAILPPTVPVVVDQVDGSWTRLELGPDRFFDLPLGAHPLVQEGARLSLDPGSLILVALPQGGAMALHSRPGTTALPAHIDLLLPVPAASPPVPSGRAPATAGLPPGRPAALAAPTSLPHAKPASSEVNP